MHFGSFRKAKLSPAAYGVGVSAHGTDQGRIQEKSKGGGGGGANLHAERKL